MSFTVKLHIQGVACFKKLPHQDKDKLIVLFPDGTPGGSRPRGLCLHLCFVQFKTRYLAHYPGTDGYVTSFLDRELLTLDTGRDDLDLALNFDHLPKIEEALPGDEHVASREIDRDLLQMNRSDGRVKGTMLVESGSFERHIDPRFRGKWYFGDDENAARTLSNTSTLTIEGASCFALNLKKLDAAEGRSIELQPDDSGIVELWLRNMCDGMPVDRTIGFTDQTSPNQIDDDFILNFQVRDRPAAKGSSVQEPPLENFRLPRLKDDVGIPSKKCMGSYWP